MRHRIAIVLAAMLFPAFAFAQSPALLEQVKKEGEVVIYTTTTVRDFEFVIKAAKEKYPFLRVQHVYLSSSRQAARVMQEYRAGKLQADVLGNSLEALLYFKDQKVIGKIESSEAKGMLPVAVDPEGYWLGTTTDLLVSAFNTKDLPRQRAPKGYDEYLQPGFKGLMAINSGVPYALTGMMGLRGEEQGIAYMKRLGQQNVRPVEGFTHMINLLAAGEYPLAIFTQVSKAQAMREKGAPVDWLAGSPTFATLSAIAVAANPPHPAGARLLVDFYLSAEGQKALVAAGKIPLRRGVKSSSKAIDDLLESGNLHVIKPEGDYSRYMKLYREFVGGK